MSWRVANGLLTLRSEIDKAAPARNKVSDGTIGDADHATRDSDHNPWLNDTVRAIDITHDPEHGVDGDVLAREFAALLGKHPAMGSGAYVIWEAQIISTDRLSEGWRPYSGSNEHRQHIHVSVGLSGYDSTARWDVIDNQEDDMADPKVLAQLDRIEKNTKQAINKLDNNVKRLKSVKQALEQLEREVQGDATKTQVRKVIAILQDPEEDA